MRKLCLLACLLSLTLVFPIFAADLDHAKTLYEEKQYEAALAEFKLVFESSTGDTRLDALLHILRCDYSLKNHAELASYYNTCISEAENTSFEPDIHFTYANSLMDSVKDYASARAVYNMLYQEFPNAPFAGSGSLLKLGDIDVIENKPNDALSRYNELETKYPDCPYIDNALLGKVKAYAALKDRTALLNALQSIRTPFPDNPCTANAGIEAGIYFATVERNREEAVRLFEEVVKEYPDTRQGVWAKIRLADLNPHNDIDLSIKLYQEALQEKSKISMSMQAWCECEMGFSYLLKGDDASARKQFENILSNGEYPSKYHAKAQRFLKALNEPDGMEAYEVSFDLAFRHREYLNGYDRADRDYGNILRIWELGVPEQKIQDPEINDAQKAKWLYKLAIARLYHTYERGAREAAQRIMDEYPDQGETTAHAMYLLAFLDAWYGNSLNGIDRFLSILETYPDVSFAPLVMREIAQCQVRLEQKENALLTLDGLSLLYPWHKEGMEAKGYIQFLLKGDAALRVKYETASLPRLLREKDSSLADLKSKSGFQSRFYDIIKNIRLAHNKKPYDKPDFEEILLSMK
jgi:TolA-binding protein